jgi:hypothetical protein
VNLKSMSLDKLVTLKTQVEAALNSKVAAERRALQEGLSKLSRFQSGARSKLTLGRGARDLLPPNTAIPRIPAKPGPDED